LVAYDWSLECSLSYYYSSTPANKMALIHVAIPMFIWSDPCLQRSNVHKLCTLFCGSITHGPVYHAWPRWQALPASSTVLSLYGHGSFKSPMPIFSYVCLTPLSRWRQAAASAVTSRQPEQSCWSVGSCSSFPWVSWFPLDFNPQKE
jgi:hypothetical protein